MISRREIHEPRAFSLVSNVGHQIYQALKSVIKNKYGQDACNVGDEGGFAPNIKNNREGIELLMEAMKKAGHVDKVCEDRFEVSDGVRVRRKSIPRVMPDGIEIVAGSRV